FEEVLYRWVLETGLRPQNRYFCLSGGFKTMSAAMQKAAAARRGGSVSCVGGGQAINHRSDFGSQAAAEPALDSFRARGWLAAVSERERPRVPAAKHP